MVKYKIKKHGPTKAKRMKWSIILGSVLTALVAGIVVLVVCWTYYQWQWEDVAYWLNPFSEGNNWTWVIYGGVIAIALLLVWLFHNARMEKILNEDK